MEPAPVLLAPGGSLTRTATITITNPASNTRDGIIHVAAGFETTLSNSNLGVQSESRVVEAFINASTTLSGGLLTAAECESPFVVGSTAGTLGGKLGAAAYGVDPNPLAPGASRTVTVSLSIDAHTSNGAAVLLSQQFGLVNSVKLVPA